MVDSLSIETLLLSYLSETLTDSIDVRTRISLIDHTKDQTLSTYRLVKKTKSMALSSILGLKPRRTYIIDRLF
jgi:hypothetical protein